jgi:hypothetical protein
MKKSFLSHAQHLLFRFIRQTKEALPVKFWQPISLIPFLQLQS